MDTISIQLSKPLFDLIAERAARLNRPPARLVEDILTEEILPRHPYVEVLDSRSGTRPVVKGTRVGIDVIAGYIQAGHAPREIVESILPDLTLAQVYDALSYYEDHRAEIDRSLQANSPAAVREALKQRLGESAAKQLLGE